MKLGAGRATKEDKIDFEAGITLHKKTNETIKKAISYYTYSSKEINPELEKELSSAYKIGSEKVKNKIIIDRLK